MNDRNEVEQETKPAGGPLPSGLRDTNEFYLNEADPLRWVDSTIMRSLKSCAGPRMLDLGCGVGGYAKSLSLDGYDVRALDVNPRYVERARSAGVDAHVFDGSHIPFGDASFDTVFMVEVLEHVKQPSELLAEAFRVASRNVVITVPNNTQKFSAPVVWDHMLDVDHKHFFTIESLRATLAPFAREIDVEQMSAADYFLAKDLLPGWAFKAHRALTRLGVRKDRFYFRLFVNARK